MLNGSIDRGDTSRCLATLAPWGGACLLVTLLALTPTRADEAADTFKALFGEEISRVSSTREFDDDLALASTMIESARTVKQPAMVVLLLDNAYRLVAKSPEGFDTAIAALEMLAERADGDRADVNDKLLTLYQRRYQATRGDARAEAGRDMVEKVEAMGDAAADAGDFRSAILLYKRAQPIANVVDAAARDRLRDKLLGAARLQRLDAEIESAKARLKAQPDNPANAAELLRLLIVEKDSPDEARKFSFLYDEPTQQMIRAASRPVEELEDADAMALAKWYQQHASDARTDAKLAMLDRAATYTRAFLDKHATADLIRTQATLMQKSIEAEVTRLESQGQARPPVGGRARKPVIVFHADKSMKPYPVGHQAGGFPVQETDDARGPFLGKGVFFRQEGATAKDVYYELKVPRRPRELYWKGAAMFRMSIAVLDKRGNVLLESGPHAGGNTWGEHRLKLPASVGTHFILRLHNEASTWYYINRIELK